MDRLPNLASTRSNMRTDEEMRGLVFPLMKGGKLQFVLKRGIPFGVLLAFGEALSQHFFVTNHLNVSTALIFFPILAIVSGTVYGIVNWYYLKRRYRIASI
jgi:hypothetical protein